mmetsp:Transcript_6747/g.10164  ORF Transcript_6747/g.10164 Transcript_6747/m.10164 type:complete len:498 (-) Transcript_6747:99-1592(-)
MMSGRLVSSFWWGQVADKWGRKPVLLVGCFSIAAFSIMFGCSETFYMALLSRFLLGLMNPIWGIAKTLVSELCPPRYEAKGMGLTTGCWSLGLVVGPACGGSLASPAVLYPHVFGSVDLFVRFPYLLPNIVTAFFACAGFVLLFLFFPETLPPAKKTHQNSPIVESDGTDECVSNAERSAHSTLENGGKPNASATMFELLQVPGVAITLVAYFVLSFNSICFDEVVPLWSMATHSHGGLGLPQFMIGTLMTIAGAILTVYTFTLYPVLARMLGKTGGFRMSQMIMGPLVVGITLLNNLPAHSSFRFPLVVVVYSIAKAMTSLGFSSIALILNHCVEKQQRGSLNGLAMTFGSIAKSFGPFLGAFVYAWSINSGFQFPLDGHLIFVVIGVCCFIAVKLPLPVESTDINPSNPDELPKHKDCDGEDSKCIEMGIVDKSVQEIPLTDEKHTSSELLQEDKDNILPSLKKMSVADTGSFYMNYTHANNTNGRGTYAALPQS